MAIQPESVADRALVITRMFDVPRERVFEAWTQAEHLVHWLGPKDFTAPFAQADARPGGLFRACIRSPEGASYWMRGTYREIVAPERLVFTFAWEDDDGKPGRETLVTVTLETVNGKTLFTFRQAVFESVAARDSHGGGWTECFERLAVHLAKTSGGPADVRTTPRTIS